ncbi:hypothetical protein ACFXA4_35385 [Streptomyces sp. NPDC059442]|uniref:hypothetical protein n=1 Tax=Streptomyces sp. NPDC059442 TaxID=3346830 RepID=UPI0036A15DE6
MAPTSKYPTSLRAARQLRRARTHYAAGVLLWASAVTWTAITHPGSRQMWVCLLLLTVFTTLLGTTSLWLHRLRRQAATVHTLAHHAAPRHASA